MADQASGEISTMEKEERRVGVTDAVGEVEAQSLQELTNLIQTLLSQTQERFQTMSDQIVKRIDEMGKRIDDLEKNINDLMSQVGVEQPEPSR